MSREDFRSVRALALAFLFASLFWGCSLQKKNDHVGAEVNHPVFHGPGDLLRSFWKVEKITVFHKLDGQPVDLSWMSPAFREKICLTVTIANHCMA